MARSMLSVAFVLVSIPLAYSQETQHPPIKREQCIAKAKRDFSRLVEKRIKYLVIGHSSDSKTIGKPNDYLTAPNPKAFALCINWDKSTPTHHYGAGFAFFSGRHSADLALNESDALADCEQGGYASRRLCKCEIVSRNGKLALNFPSGWAEKQCPDGEG